MSKKYVVLEPNPRLLSMLGKLPLKGWQCIAELIDNSIDAMIKKGNSKKNSNNEIKITLPSSGQIDQNMPIVVSDNGSGMNEEQIVAALTAGLSGKTTDTDLGLYGMGFNIATAKIGRATTVWSSTEDSDKDIGITINLPEMTKMNSFKRELLTRKNSETSAKGKHGTTIEIKDYNQGAKKLLSRPDLIRNLKNVYSSILSTKYDIDIKVTDNKGWVDIKPKRFCIWDKDRSVTHQKEGEIKPYIEFDQKISENLYCTICLMDLETELINDGKCFICGNTSSIITKEIKIHGWLGIQRYFSQDRYGLDIVRNGRIIKQWDKSFFHWTDRKGKHELPKSLEYPIDNQRLGGRIVGEIHADFIIPEFTKDSFSITEQWLDVIEIVRGDRPIQPEWATKRFKMGGRNKSPLAMLFYGFRKTTPGRKDLVCGVKNGGANAGNKPALEYSRKFYDGDEEFQSDEKWYELVMLAEEGTDTGGPGLPRPDDPPPIDPPEPENQYPGLMKDIGEITFDLERIIDVSPITTKIYEYDPGIIEFNPVIFEAESRNVYHVRLNQMHNMIKDFEESWQDLVMMEVAQRFHSQLFNTEEWPISKIYFELKSKYYPEKILNIDNIVTSAKSLMRDLHNYLINQSVKLSPKPNLAPSLLERLKSEYREIENKNLKKPSTILSDSGYVKYLDISYLHEFIRDYPNLIFDGKFLSLSYEEFNDDPEYQEIILRDYFAHFSHIAWITDILSDMTDVKRKAQKSKIISAKLVLEYLLEARV